MYYTANTGYILSFNRLTLASAGSAAAVDVGIYSVNQSIHNSDYCDGYPTMIPKNKECLNSLGINELENSKTFTIYPNPSMGAFTIETDVNDYTLVITNLLGQKILTKKINTEKAEISLFKQAEGMYFVQEQYQNSIATQKLILIK